MTKTNVIILIKFLIGVSIILIISLLPCPVELNRNAMEYLGILAGMIYFLIVNICPEYITVMFSLGLCCVFQVDGFINVFSAFSNTTVWLLIGVLPLSVMISQSGLMRRVALHVMSSFPNTYAGQLLAITVAGIIISPTIPSITAKATILAPFAISVAQEMKFENKSKGMMGLFMAAYLMGAVSGHVFYSGSMNVFIMMGLLPEDIQNSFNWWSWLKCTCIWGICIFILGFIAIKVLYRPKETVKLEPDYIKRKIKELGSITSYEKNIAIVLVFTLIGWITKSIHGIPEAAIAILGYTILMFMGQGKKQDFRSKVAWDMIIFIGGLMCMSTIMTDLGIDIWLSNVFTPIIKPMLANEYVYIISLSVLVALSRYFIVSAVSAVSLFYVIFAVPAQGIGISPWVTIFIVTTISQLWSTRFNSTTYLTSVAVVGEDKLDFKEAVKLSHIYVVISIIGFLLSIPMWKYIGLIV